MMTELSTSMDSLRLVNYLNIIIMSLHMKLSMNLLIKYLSLINNIFKQSMIAFPNWFPIGSTYITKLMRTAARYVITSLISLDMVTTPRTLLYVQLFELLQNLGIVLIIYSELSTCHTNVHPRTTAQTVMLTAFQANKLTISFIVKCKTTVWSWTPL